MNNRTSNAQLKAMLANLDQAKLREHAERVRALVAANWRGDE